MATNHRGQEIGGENHSDKMARARAELASTGETFFDTEGVVHSLELSPSRNFPGKTDVEHGTFLREEGTHMAHVLDGFMGVRTPHARWEWGAYRTPERAIAAGIAMVNRYDRLGYHDPNKAQSEIKLRIKARKEKEEGY